MAATYVVERSANIAVPRETLFARIANLRAWSEWSPWEDLDLNLEKDYTGTDGAVGSSYRWQGNRKAGQGKMTISDVDAPERVTTDLQFVKPFKSRSMTEFTLTSDGAGTTVTWTMTGNHTWMSRVMGLFMSMDRMVGRDFEKGLEKLKAVSET